jgi:two-component system, NarL family, nitrate/nitrite response regulator NarL
MKFLIVDDHSLLRDGLAALLRQFGADTEVISASDGSSAIEIVATHPELDAVILDLAMPDMDGAAALEAIARRRPDLPVIVLSASEKASDVRRVMALGALGYIPKSASHYTLLAAIEMVLAGEIYVPPLLLSEARDALAPAPHKLTPRQLDVLACMCRGLSNKAIANDLNMSEKTVKAHVTGILRTLGATNRVQAIAIARDSALIA